MMKSTKNIETQSPIEVLENAYAELKRMKGSKVLKFSPPALSAPIAQERSHYGKGELMTDCAAIFDDSVYIPVELGAYRFSLGRVHYVDGSAIRQAFISGSYATMPHNVGSMLQSTTSKKHKEDFSRQHDRKNLARIGKEDSLVFADHTGNDGIQFTSIGESKRLKQILELVRPGPIELIDKDITYYEARAIEVLKAGLMKIAEEEVRSIQGVTGGYVG